MNNLTEILDKFKEKKILVVGDIMLDKYLIGDVDRISGEAPVPILNVKEEIYIPGGAANVANNLVSLGAKVILAGTCNTDQEGKILLAELKNKNIETCVIKEKDRPTTLKCRLLSNNHQLVRYDKELTDELPIKLQRKLAKKIEFILEDIDGVIFSDYDKGVFSEYLAQKIIKNTDKMVFVDPKPVNVSYFKGCTVIRPNRHETEKITGIKYDQENLEKMSKKLAEIAESKYSVISCGEDGLFVYDPNGASRHIKTRAKQVADVTGAGDTLISVLALAMVLGLDLYNAAELANYASGIVVGKVGTATTTIDELKETIEKS